MTTGGLGPFTGRMRFGAQLRRVLVGIVAAACAATPAASPSPTATAATSVVAPATPTAQLSTGPRPAPSSVATTAVRSIPREFLYAETSPINDASLWLVDPTTAAQPVSIVRWSGGSGSSAWSRDGQTVVVAGPSDRSQRALFLVRPLTGRATVLYEASSTTRAFYPRVSADGRRFAFMLFGDAAAPQVFWGDIATGAVHALLPDPQVGALLGWTEDGAWLAFSRQEGSAPCQQQMYLLNVDEGRTVGIGPGNLAAFRVDEPRVALACVGGRGDQGAFGADLALFDIAKQQVTRLTTIAPAAAQLAWSPNRAEFLVLQNTTGCLFRSSVLVASANGPTRRIGTLENVAHAWWSTNGADIYALVPGTGSELSIVDAATGRLVTSIPSGGPVRPCP